MKQSLPCHEQRKREGVSQEEQGHRRQREALCGGWEEVFTQEEPREEKDCGWGIRFQAERTACAETAWCVQQTVSVTKWEEEEGGQVRYKIQISL